MENVNTKTGEHTQLKTVKTFRREHLFFINDNHGNKTHHRHKSNRISTTKYNIFTFLPKSLLFQFLRLANIYFLILAIIQCIEVISPLSASTAIYPLAIVLCASMIREGYEDFQRHRYDTILNSEHARVFRDGAWHDCKSGSLHIGELVIVEEDKPFPADLILLDSNLTDGVAYIETGTLDGEKTLKNKVAPKETVKVFVKGNHSSEVSSDFKIDGIVKADYPNSDLYKLEGSMDINLTVSNAEQHYRISLNAKQLVLKGALLRNTGFIVGVVVYTGHNTKLILNSKKPRMKFSRIEKLMSRMLIFILFLQMCLCIICAAIHSVYWNQYVSINPYLPKVPSDLPNVLIMNVVSYFTYLLLLNTMIPISLIITLEVTKVVQGFFIEWDIEGYSHIRKKFIKAGSISLNEELGQVNYIFSDKTGTLTCNKMVFKYCVIGDVGYEYVRGQDNDEDKRKRDELNIKAFSKGQMCQMARSKTTMDKSQYNSFVIYSDHNPNLGFNMSSESTVLDEYWKALSMCHECIVEEKDSSIEYTGLSPDDIELVKTAASQGYEFLKSLNTNVRKINIMGTPTEFELLNLLEFNSDRKRASVIVRDGDMIKLYIKGADSIIKERLSPATNGNFLQQAKYYVDHFSAHGFRTLFVGMKILDEKEYKQWSQKLYEASLQVENRQQAVDAVYDEIESNIHLIGATIVEDKLQDQVPECIRDLRLAGIKIWMLTGDKMDTAYNIGLSCNLISKDLQLFKLSGEKGDKLEKLLKEFSGYEHRFSPENTLPPYSIIVDAVALRYILSDENSIKLFLEIANKAVAVICCRVTPLQKSEVVKIMKEFNPTASTLAIGDGGNDVSMIMEAHIGVGVYGEEGMRAVQSGDFAIGEFKILRRLLFYHGRTNNIRISNMILYFFYKNFVFTIAHFYYAFYNNCSGQTIIEDMFITMYNLLFTAFPLGTWACSDFDIKPDDGKIIYLMMPFTYKENRDKPIFTKITFVLNLLRGIVHGIINFFFLVFLLDQPSVDKDGHQADLWYFSVNLYTNIIFIVSIRLITQSRFITWINAIVMIVGSWFLYFGFIVICHFSSSNNSNATMGVTFNSGKLYFNFVLVIVTCAMIDYMSSALKVLFSSKIAGSLMVLVNKRNTLDNNVDLPSKVVNFLRVYDNYGADSNVVKPLVANSDYNNMRNANVQDLDKIDNIHIDVYPGMRKDVLKVSPKD